MSIEIKIDDLRDTLLHADELGKKKLNDTDVKDFLTAMTSSFDHIISSTSPDNPNEAKVDLTGDPNNVVWGVAPFMQVTSTVSSATGLPQDVVEANVSFLNSEVFEHRIKPCLINTQPVKVIGFGNFDLSNEHTVIFKPLSFSYLDE